MRVESEFKGEKKSKISNPKILIEAPVFMHGVNLKSVLKSLRLALETLLTTFRKIQNQKLFYLLLGFQSAGLPRRHNLPRHHVCIIAVVVGDCPIMKLKNYTFLVREDFDMSSWTSLITALTLLLYLVITVNVGRARAKYKVPPPQMAGDADFERVLRVQQNTLEQMVLFLPGLWLFSFYVNPLWGAVIGAIWLVGRIAYAWGYYQAASKRMIGFVISSFSSIVLLLGSLVGIILFLVQP